MQRSSCKWLVFCQLIVIIHGRQGDDKFPAWPIQMGQSLTGLSKKEVQKSIVDLENGANKDSPPNLLLYDWSKLSEDRGIVDDDRVGGTLNTVIREKCNRLKSTRKKPVDVLIIAHSRGCYVACEACRRLEKYNGFGFLEMTMLDPRTYPEIVGSDGKLEANPGGVIDWLTVYQQAVDPLYKGRIVDDALNVNLDRALSNFPLLLGENKHSQVHRWYLGTLLQRGEITKGDNIKYIQLYGGNSKYPDPAAANGPIVENFNGPISLVSSIFQAKRLNGTTHTPDLLPIMAQGQTTIGSGVLQLTPARTWVGGSAFMNATIVGDFVAQFTFQMSGKIGTRPADGIAFVLIEPPIQPMGMLGGFHGFAGMGKGFAVVFDNYYNWEQNDPRDVAQKVGIRAGAGKFWQMHFAPDKLPDSLLSGNRFRVRLTFIGRKIRWQMYCHGTDKRFETEMDIPNDFYVPNVKYVGFSASTGDGGQQHIIDDVLIVPLTK